MEKAESLRLQAYLPQSYWKFATENATHIYNRTPMRQLKWHTPYEWMTGEKPTMHYLRVFGSSAYVFIPSEVRKREMPNQAEAEFPSMRVEPPTTRRSPTAVAPPLPEEPNPPRRSQRAKKVPKKPGNIYGDKHPVQIELETRKTRDWRKSCPGRGASSCEIYSRHECPA